MEYLYNKINQLDLSEYIEYYIRNAKYTCIPEHIEQNTDQRGATFQDWNFRKFVLWPQQNKIRNQ